jgi:hypothetical protein
MERLYYVQRENATAETSDRFEAARIAAEWVRRGYKVSEIAVDVTERSVQLVDGWNEKSAGVAQGDSSATRQGEGGLPAREPRSTG